MAPNGAVARYGERTMPRVADLLLDATVYLYESKEAAERGVALGGSGGQRIAHSARQSGVRCRE